MRRFYLPINKVNVIVTDKHHKRLKCNKDYSDITELWIKPPVEAQRLTNTLKSITHQSMETGSC